MYLSDKKVAARYGVARGTPWRWIKQDRDFPKPIELTPGCTRWRLEDFEIWEQARAGAAVTQCSLAGQGGGMSK